MIRIEGTRFGLIEVEDKSLIRFVRGIVGFEKSTEYILLERSDGHSTIAVLQSVQTPSLAFPVMDAALFGTSYPQPPPEELAISAGLGNENIAMLVTVAADSVHQCLEVNLLAPLVIDMETRMGAQVMLDPRRYSIQFTLPADQYQSALPPASQIRPRAKLRPAMALAAAVAI